MKGHVDKDTCIACGLCPSICPEIFFMDDDGKAEGKNEEIPNDILDSAQEARDSCPVDAIDVN